MTEKMDRKSLHDLKVAERIIDRLASEAHDEGMLVHAWHGPRQSRLFVKRWSGADVAEAGYVEVERDGRPPSTTLRVNWQALREIDVDAIRGLSERAKAMLHEEVPHAD